ncbi:hypothetical protein DFJ73DRAFT_855069 [Zopfochytrium polystomum]|nr:hypothetical protein DFJ73DRAFT_855069 [Zopfochytrium polystomum]
MKKFVVHTLSNDFEAATKLVEVDERKLLSDIPKGFVVVKNHFVGINASDTNYTAGRYDPSVRPPFDCGFESVGEVIGVGPGVTKLKVGQTVLAMGYGAFAECHALRASSCIPVPSARPEFLALLVSGLTASIALKNNGRMTTGETVLVTAAAGGAGQIAVQLAKLAGNHVIGTCSSDDKVSALKALGCDRVINYKKESVRDVLKKEYPKGVDIVFESVGGQMFQDCFNALAVKGRMIVIGAMSVYSDKNEGGPINSFKHVWKDQVPTLNLLNKSSTVTGFFLNHYAKDFASHMAEMASMVQSGKLKPSIDMGNFKSLEDVPAAIKLLQSGKNIGKIIVPVYPAARSKL